MTASTLRTGPRRFAVLTLLVALAIAPAMAQERFSGLTGEVRDASSAVLPGATVTITNKENGKLYTAVTGADGVYRILDLEPGRYGVKFELSGFQPAEVPDVVLLLGKTLTIDSTLKVGTLQEAVTVTAESPLIDTRSTTIAHNVTAEEFDRIPKGRSFQNLAFASPSVNTGEIEGGIQVNGASGAENAFTIDGVTTNSLINGGSRQDAVFEYLQEVQVKTGGINAEYGGALGGVVSAVTKSGGNQYRGEAHYYFTGASTSAGPVKRLVLDPLDDRTVRMSRTPNSPTTAMRSAARSGGQSSATSCSSSGRGRHATCAGRTSTCSRAARRIRSSRSRRSTARSERSTTIRPIACAPVSRCSGRQRRRKGRWRRTMTRSRTRSPARRRRTRSRRTRGFEVPQTSYAGTLDFTLNNSSLISVRGGYFDDNYKDTGVPTFSSVSYQTSAVGLGYPIAADQLGGVGFQNTPRVQLSEFDHTQRGYVQADFIKAFTMGGSHNFKGGVGYQHTANDVKVAYPGGGYVWVYWDRSFTSNDTGRTDRGPYGYYEVDDRGVQGKASADIWSLYVQDQWTIRNLTLNLGLRTEREIIPSFRTDVQDVAFKFGFGDKLAPRIGASYDVFNDGRLKLYGSWGRYFDWTKYEVSRGAFGADVWRVRYRSLDTTDAFSLSGTNMPGRNLWNDDPDSFQDKRIPNFDTVDPNLKPMSQDAFNAGAEYQLRGNMTFQVNYAHANLRRTIEDLGVLVNGSEEYKYVNPGEGIAATMNPSGPTPVFDTPKPKRQYDALELSLEKRFSNNWFGSASYVYSSLYGNYAGLANSDEIATPTTNRTQATPQQQAGSIARPGSSANRAWDLDELMWDAHGNLDVLGRLATDRPHVMKLYGAYMLPTGTQVGARDTGPRRVSPLARSGRRGRLSLADPHSYGPVSGNPVGPPSPAASAGQANAPTACTPKHCR